MAHSGLEKNSMNSVFETCTVPVHLVLSVALCAQSEELKTQSLILLINLI